MDPGRAQQQQPRRGWDRSQSRGSGDPEAIPGRPLSNLFPPRTWSWLARELEDLRSRAGGAASNPFATTLAQSGASLPPPSIRAIQNLGTVTVEWGAAPVSDLLYYEVQFSTSNGFTNPITKKTRELFYTLEEGDPGVTYYARVRTVSQGFGTSAWSPTVNTATGLATSANLDFGAASEIVTMVQSSAFTPAMFDAGAAGRGASETVVYPNDFQIVPIESKGGVILPFVGFEFEYEVSWDTSSDPAGIPRMTAQFLVDGLASGPPAIIDWPSADSTLSGVTTVPGLGTPTQPIVGEYEFSLELTVTSGTSNSWLDITPRRIEINLVELRR